LGAVAAVFSKSRLDAPSVAAKMLCAMKHRAQDGAAVAWDGDFESAPSPSHLNVSSPASRSAVGYGFTRILPGDSPQPIRAGEGWLCLDGRIGRNGTLVQGEEAAQFLKKKLTSGEFPSIQRETDGAYSICFSTRERLLVTRDPIGLKSTFIGRKGDLVAVASDRKALWAIGIGEVATFPPGGCLKADSERSTVQLPLRQAGTGRASSLGSNGADELSRLLDESVSIQTHGVAKVAAGFSGGVDSTVVAKIARDKATDLLLVAVGVGRTLEMMQAQSTAEEIGLPIVTRELSADDIEECLDQVLWLIEEPNLMKVSVAVAMHWTARVALENERSVIMLGQGSDELFGGYKRFATILGERGSEAALKAISESIRNAHEVNYQRDEQAVSSLRAELRLPYATRKMAELASTVPLNMKVRSTADDLRKWILRDAAIRLGIPPTIAMRPKKAIQHTSGIEKTIREIAKKHGLAPSAYLAGRFQALRAASAVC